jgi:hypothetical protein
LPTPLLVPVTLQSLALSTPNAIKYKATVEMYQWVESTHTTNGKKKDKTKTETTYSKVVCSSDMLFVVQLRDLLSTLLAPPRFKEWSTKYHNSNAFEKPSGHENPTDVWPLADRQNPVSKAATCTAAPARGARRAPRGYFFSFFCSD